MPALFFTASSVVSELIDQGVTNALDGMPVDGRRAVTRRLWDALLDGDGS